MPRLVLNQRIVTIIYRSILQLISVQNFKCDKRDEIIQIYDTEVDPRHRIYSIFRNDLHNSIDPSAVSLPHATKPRLATNIPYLGQQKNIYMLEIRICIVLYWTREKLLKQDNKSNIIIIIVYNNTVREIISNLDSKSEQRDWIDEWTKVKWWSSESAKFITFAQWCNKWFE